MSKITKLDRAYTRLLARERSIMARMAAPGGDTKKNETLLREVVGQRKEALASAAEAEYEASEKKKAKEEERKKKDRPKVKEKLKSLSRRGAGGGGGMNLASRGRSRSMLQMAKDARGPLNE